MYLLSTRDTTTVIEPYPGGDCTHYGIPTFPNFLSFHPQGNITFQSSLFGGDHSGLPFQIDFTCETEEPCEDIKSSKYCKKQKKKGKCKKANVWKKCQMTCEKC